MAYRFYLIISNYIQCAFFAHIYSLLYQIYSYIVSFCLGTGQDLHLTWWDILLVLVRLDEHHLREQAMLVCLYTFLISLLRDTHLSHNLASTYSATAPRLATLFQLTALPSQLIYPTMCVEVSE